MAEFEIKTNSIKSVAGQERRVAGKLISACSRMEDCRNALDVSVSSQYGAVKGNITRLSNQLSAAVSQMSSLADALEEIYSAYEATEREICGYPVKYAKISNVKNGTITMETVSDGLSAISKWIKALNDQADNPYAKTLAAMLSMISSGMGLSESENFAQWFTSFMGFSGSTIGFGSKFEKTIIALINKCGTPSAQEWLKNNDSILSSEMKGMGAIGNAFGFAAKFVGAIQDSDSFAAFLKNSDGWISSGGGLVGELNGLDKDAIKGTANPIIAMVNMASYAAGDIIELSTDGHPMTAQELSNLFLGTGLKGAKSCVSQITFGLVDIDTDRSKGIFDKNIAWTTDKICSFDIPTSGQAALGFVATPFVALYSMGETFFDMGYQIGEGINNGLHSLAGH